jgi:hypothetical protein
MVDFHLLAPMLKKQSMVLASCKKRNAEFKWKLKGFSGFRSCQCIHIRISIFEAAKWFFTYCNFDPEEFMQKPIRILYITPLFIWNGGFPSSPFSSINTHAEEMTHGSGILQKTIMLNTHKILYVQTTFYYIVQ